jgi:uncharacterized protein
MAQIVSDGIRFYQQYLSPYKGFRCAHRALHGRTSCSEFARRAVVRYGPARMVELLERRLSRCASAAKAMHYQSQSKRENRSHTGIDTCADNIGAEACWGISDIGCAACANV